MGVSNSLFVPHLKVSDSLSYCVRAMENEGKMKAILEEFKSWCDDDGKETNPVKSAECLQKLSTVLKIDQKDDKLIYVERCTLLNGVLHRINQEQDEKRKGIWKEEVKSELIQLGRDLLQQSGAPNTNADILRISDDIKKQLEKYREEIRSTISGLEKIQYEMSGDVLKRKEEERIADIENLLRKISSYYSEIMRRISDACVDLLGDKPCRFSHFAMGSLSRDEVTLYSDFENGILLENDLAEKREECLEYFRLYAVLFDVILINFGETLIRLKGIKGLNDFQTEDKLDDWFYDIFTTGGIMFDSNMPCASKTPFGRLWPTKKKNDTTELILPVNEMIKYLEEDKSIAEGYHLAEMLCQSKHIAGDESLYLCYNKLTAEKMKVLLLSPNYINMYLKSNEDDLVRFDLTPYLNSMGWKKNAKKSFYRTVTLFVPFIARVFGIVEYTSNFEAVNLIQAQTGKSHPILSDETVHNIRYAIAIANQIRVKVYSERCAQDDMLYGTVLIARTSEDNGSENVVDAVGKRSTVDICEISLSLRQAVCEIHNLVTIALKEEGRINTEDISRMIEEYLGKRGNLKTQGDVLRQFQDYNAAIECYENALAIMDQRNEQADLPEKAKIYMEMGLCQIYSLSFEKSISCYTKAIEIEENNKKENGDLPSYNHALSLTMMGQGILELESRRSQFGDCIKAAFEEWEKLIESDASCSRKEYVKGKAEAYDTKAWFLFRTEQYDESLSNYTEAQKIFEIYYGKGNFNNDTTKVQNGIALCLLHLERYDI